MIREEKTQTKEIEVTSVFLLRDGLWFAIWRNQNAPSFFNSKGAAQAWVSTCNAKGKYHN